MINKKNYFVCSNEAMDYLSAKDSKLKVVIDELGQLNREGDDDLFRSVVKTIVGQQISIVAQATIWKRMLEGYGEIIADSVISSSIDDIQSHGISFRKAEYIMDFAQKVNNRELDIDALYDMDDSEVVATLCQLKGIGKWTAEMLMLFCMKRQDIFSYGDLAICRGLRMLHHHRHIDEKLFEKYRRRYSPYGSAASLYMWAISANAIPNMKDYGKKKVEVMKVEDIKTNCAVYSTKVGDIAIRYTNYAVVSIIINDNSADSKLSITSDISDMAYNQICEYLDGQRNTFDLPTKLVGTDFQKKVWKALMSIPYGETRSYKDIAQMINSPKSSRAVGLANNKNPLHIVVPCHRVIGSNGKLMGYAAGIHIKQQLLDMEKG